MTRRLKPTDLTATDLPPTVTVNSEGEGSVATPFASTKSQLDTVAGSGCFVVIDTSSRSVGAMTWSWLSPTSGSWSAVSSTLSPVSAASDVRFEGSELEVPLMTPTGLLPEVRAGPEDPVPTVPLPPEELLVPDELPVLGEVAVTFGVTGLEVLCVDSPASP